MRNPITYLRAPRHLDRTDPATVAAGQPLREDARRASREGRPVHLLALLVPILVLFNLVAMFGQGSFIYDHGTQTEWDPIVRLCVAIGFALSIELIGVLLAALAHDARMDDQPSAGTRVASYLVGLAAGGMNFGHFYDPERVGDTLGTALGFALLSTASPFLWALWSSAVNKSRRKAMGDVRKRGVRLSPSRMFWHPLLSVRLMSWAAWEGITDEDDAVRGWTLMAGPAKGAPVSGAPGGKSKAEWWAEAEAVRAENPGISQKAVAEQLGISTRWLRECRDHVQGQTKEEAA